MTTSRRTQLVRFCSFGEVGVQRMDPPVFNGKKKRPTIAVEAAGRSKDRSMRLGFQKLGLIKNLNRKSREENEDDSGCSILTLGSPHLDDDDDDDDDQVVDYSFGVFLKSCSLCKKRITRNMDIFMFGYLKAFCSPECREVQIEKDESLRPPSPEPTLLSTIARMVGASNDSKLSSPESGLSANVNNHSVSIFD